MPAPSKAQLEKAQDELAIVVMAAEQWAPTWKKSPDQWREAIRIQNRLRRGVSAYYRDLAKQIPQFIDWMKYTEAVGKIKADDSIDGESSLVYESRIIAPDGASLLVRIIFDGVNAAAQQGAISAQNLYQRYAGTTELNQVISRNSLRHVEDLVKNLGQTTVDRITQSINTSIRLGETTQQAADRLLGIVDDATRADMIARTEMVRAYNSGIVDFGRASGAERKVWESFVGACVTCEQINGEQVPIDDNFSTGDDYPPDHPRCKCLTYLVYGDPTIG